MRATPIPRVLRATPMPRVLRATPRPRVLVMAVLAGVLIAATVVGAMHLVGPPKRHPTDAGQAFGKAHTGDCLNWSPDSPNQVLIVGCTNEHRFEVAAVVDGVDTERAATAAPGTPEQIAHSECQVSVQRYLGAHYDPNGRFTAGVLSSGDSPPTQRRMLCGLQLPGAHYEQQAFTGRVSQADQSKVWPAGTCLGIAVGSHRSTGVPVDCSQPHAMEVTGTVNLGDKFSEPPPTDVEQRQVIADACARITDAYLAPIKLPTTTLTPTTSTIPAQSWMAGSRKQACTIGAPIGNGGWASLTGNAKGTLSINGRPPAADAARLNQSSAPSSAPSSPPSAPTRTLAPAPHLPASPPPDADGPPDAGNPDNPPVGPPPGPAESPAPSG